MLNTIYYTPRVHHIAIYMYFHAWFSYVFLVPYKFSQSLMLSYIPIISIVYTVHSLSLICFPGLLCLLCLNCPGLLCLQLYLISYMPSQSFVSSQFSMSRQCLSYAWSFALPTVQLRGNVALAHIISSSRQIHSIMCRVQ